MTPTNTLEARVAVLEQQVNDSTATLNRIERRVDEIRLDIHAAKVGGRWLIGVALAVGGIVGFFVKLWLERKGA